MALAIELLLERIEFELKIVRGDGANDRFVVQRIQEDLDLLKALLQQK